MPALDLIRPSVTAMRVIASVNAEFARELKLPPHIRSLGLISADSDDVTYIAADEATKQAMVEVVYGRSLYAGAAHGPSPTAGEVLIMLGGPNPAEVRAGLDAMGAMLEDAQPMVTAESISHQSYRRLLSRAREYVLENMSEPVTVLDLCNQLHVSRRTLQNAFHAILGIGPNAWLKRIRLNAVRRELISPWSQSTTVKDAAMQWGFWHLGQFATDYQQLFAEKPSLTLHQRMREWG